MVYDKNGHEIKVGSHINVMNLRCNKSGEVKCDKHGKSMKFNQKATVIQIDEATYGFYNVFYKGWYSHRLGIVYPVDCEVIDD